MKNEQRKILVDGRFFALDAPTIEAEEITIDGQVLWRFQCDHCQTYHHHGPGPGHRMAHCHDVNSPLEAKGYNLRKKA